MSKSIKLLMVLVLFAGVTACSGTETESETVEEAPIEEVAEEPAFACYWLDPASNAWVSMDDLTTQEACVEMDSCSGGGGRSGGGCYTWSDEPPAVEEAAASPGLDEWGVPGDKIETFTIERGQPVDVTDSHGTQIKIEADKLVDENGNLPEGDLTLSMYTYDLSNGEMPGDMSGKNTDGEAVAMESAGAFYASFEDAEGNAFNTVADGAMAEISVPVSEEMVREEPPTTWSYDPSTGLWVEEGVAEYRDLAYGENADGGTMAMGSAGTVFFASYVSGAGNTLNTNAPSSVAQQGEFFVARLFSFVLHFSAWNFDWEMRDSACINLGLPQAYLDANSPVSVRAVKADGQALDIQLSDVENVLYNLPANTDVSLYIPKDASAPFAEVNTGAAWGGTGAPPAPASSCLGVQFEPPSAAADDAPETEASTGPVRLEGQVVSATTGDPISGVKVCHDASSGECTTSSDTGTFMLEKAAPGPVKLFFEHADYVNIDQLLEHTGEGHSEKVVLSPNLAVGEIRITLSWDLGSDLDSHLWLPESSPFDVHHGAKGASDGPPNALLDIDDTSTGGPETITINKRVDGTYHFAVHHYDCKDSGVVCDVAGKSPIVRVYGNAGLVKEFSSPTGVGEWWHVFSMDGLSGEVTPINVVQAAEPVTYQ